MITLAAGLLASVIAYAANRFSYAVWRDSVIIGAVPLTEEVAKTMTARLLRANVLHTHVIFGLIEGILDWRGGKKHLPALVSAVVAHSLFGFMTARVALETGNLGLGILAGVLLHTVWNATLLFCAGKR